MARTDTPPERWKSAQNACQTADSVNDPDSLIVAIDESGKETSTKAAYLRNLTNLSAETDRPLGDMAAGELSDHIDSVSDDRDWSDSTLTQYQSAALVYVNYVGGDADAVTVTGANSDPALDPRTVLDPEEFHDLRDATRTARDTALVDLLGYTGQRIRVIQNLRLTDIDADDGTWYMPTDVDGLKGADKVGQKRPLLAARKAVANWIEHHPTGDAEDYLITPMPSAPNSTPGDMIGATSIRERLRRIRDWADVDSKVNPHAFRHFFVTVAKRRYEMDDDTIKHIIGHAPDSNVMNTTYAHLTDDDHIAAANAALGLGTDDADDLAPPVCDRCQRPLRPSASNCPTPGCGGWDDSDAGKAGDTTDDSGDGDVEELHKLLDSASNEELGAVVREHLS